MSNAEDSYEDLEQQGEPAVRRWVNTVSPLDADQVALKRAKAWLLERETERTSLASERKENREIDALSIARQSLANSQRATRIAIFSLVLSIVLALKMLLDAYAK